MTGLVPRDERELAVDHAADRLSYLVLSFGVLVVVAIRGLVAEEASWDLLALVIVAGAAGTLYRVRAGAAGRRWFAAAGLAAVLAGVIGAALAVGILR